MTSLTDSLTLGIAMNKCIYFMSIIFILTACTSDEDQRLIDVYKKEFIQKYNIKDNSVSCKHDLVCYHQNCDYCNFIRQDDDKLVFFSCTNSGCYYE